MLIKDGTVDMYGGMQMIYVDSREKENSHIKYHFLTNCIPHIENQTLIIGDYINMNKPNVFVERKANWLEFSANCGKQHDRFKRQLMRLDQCGGKMYIIIEEDTPLTKWKSHRTKMSGETMQKIIDSWKSKHNVEIIQCRIDETANRIIELLS